MNVDLANQADTSSFCPPGHTSRPTFSPARFSLISMPVPASWIPKRLAPPQTDLGSPITIKGLVCQVLGQTWKGPQRSQQGQMEHSSPHPPTHRRRSSTEGTPGGGRPSPWVYDSILKHAQQTKPGQNPRSKERKP